MNARGFIAIALLLATGAAALPAFAAGDDGSGDPNAIGHSADGYYWEVPGAKIELPRMFLVRRPDGSLGFDAFWSTHSALESPRYTLGTGVTGTNTAEASTASLTTDQVEWALENHEHIYFPVVYAEPGGAILVDFSITRQLLFVFISALVVLLIGFRLAARYKKGVGRETAPHGTWQNMLETIIVFIRDDVAKPTIGKKYQKYLPYLLTAFFFILIGNLLGLVPWGVTATSSIMVTASLAFFTFMVTQFAGTKDYWRHIFWPPNVPVPIKFILIPVEVIGMFTKPLALAFRLFGNMVSGHLVIVSILGLIFIFAAQLGTGIGIGMVFISVPLTIFIFLLKLMVCFVQAYIFTILSAVFIGMAAEEHEHHDHEHVGDIHNRLPHGGDELPQGEHQLEDYLSATPDHPERTATVTA